MTQPETLLFDYPEILGGMLWACAVSVMSRSEMDQPVGTAAILSWSAVMPMLIIRVSVWRLLAVFWKHRDSRVGLIVSQLEQ